MDTTNRILSPEEAEAVVDRRIEEFGPGSLPKVTVRPLEDGRWRVSWDSVEHRVAPMNSAQWHDWLEWNVGSLDPEDLQTTEA